MRIYLLLFCLFINPYFFELKAQDAWFIKSIELTNQTGDQTPFFNLNERLHFSFDDLLASQDDYYYLVKFYDKDWKESNLQESEYINGFVSDRIRGFKNSENTLQFYTHYQVEFPNKNTRILRTGNFKIFLLNKDKEVLAERRFILFQPRVNVFGDVYRSRDIQTKFTHQRLQFEIDYSQATLDDPTRDVSVSIFQNGNFHLMKSDLKPQYNQGRALIYKYDQESTFEGSNEFLNFDSKYLRTSNSEINEVRATKDLYETILYSDPWRQNDVYTYYPDINGDFKIQAMNVEDSSTLGDYTFVSFSLRAPEKIKNDIYIVGRFNNFSIQEESKMWWDQKSKMYKGEILMKQGFYNYKYIIDGDSYNRISGNSFQTENNYQILVYYQKFGSRYYEVIGFSQLSSAEIKS